MTDCLVIPREAHSTGDTDTRPPYSGVITQRDPRTLQPHPLNAQLYGTEVDAGLRADIAENGIREPLRITADGTIISGHSRCAIAVALGLSEVPVIVSPLDDPTEIVAEMISSNNKRKKTHHVVTREYQQLKGMQTKLAKRRMQAGRTVAPAPMANWPQGLLARKGTARDLAAEMLGMKARTAERALKVVQAIDRAQKKGDEESVHWMIKRLNKSILGGYKAAHALGYLAEDQLRTAMTPVKQCTWARWQWDPITGCQGACAYCASADHAAQAPAEFMDRTAALEEQERQLRDPFAPRLHGWRLQAPLHTRVSDGEEPAHYRVLTCWQGELFGPWVPLEWIDQVLGIVRTSAEQGLPWQYLFLTQYPTRLLEIEWPSNAWVGVTVDSQERVLEAGETLRELKQRYPTMVIYLVCEPLREELRFISLAMCSWLLIGGQTRTAMRPEFHPPWQWVLALMAQAARDGCRVIARPTLKWEGLQSGLEADEETMCLEEDLLTAFVPLLHQVIP